MILSGIFCTSTPSTFSISTPLCPLFGSVERAFSSWFLVLYKTTSSFLYLFFLQGVFHLNIFFNSPYSHILHPINIMSYKLFFFNLSHYVMFYMWTNYFNYIHFHPGCYIFSSPQMNLVSTCGIIIYIGSIQSRAVQLLPNTKDVYPLSYHLPSFCFSWSPSLGSSKILPVFLFSSYRAVSTCKYSLANDYLPFKGGVLT